MSAAKPRTGAHPAKLDSDKFGDKVARPMGRSPKGCLGAEPPATFLRRSRPGVWGGAPTAAPPSGYVTVCTSSGPLLHNRRRRGPKCLWGEPAVHQRGTSWLLRHPTRGLWGNLEPQQILLQTIFRYSLVYNTPRIQSRQQLPSQKSRIRDCACLGSHKLALRFYASLAELRQRVL